MKTTKPLLIAAVLAAFFAGPSHAAGPFNLLSKSFCDSTCCDSNCDNSCAPACGCETQCCAEPACGCEAGCDFDTCDSGCDSCGCGLGLGKLLDDPCDCNYVSMFTGWNFLHDYSGNNGAPLNVSGSFNDGWAIGGAIGRRIRNSWRAELEFAFRDNTGDAWIVNGAPGTWSGHANVYSGMANLYRDFNGLGRLTPYVGGGIGFATVDADLVTSMTTITVDDTAFAYQMMVGLSTKVSRNADIFAEYRYFGFDEVEVFNAGAGFAFIGENLEAENVFVGLRLYR